MPSLLGGSKKSKKMEKEKINWKELRKIVREEEDKAIEEYLIKLKGEQNGNISNTNTSKKARSRR